MNENAYEGISNVSNSTTWTGLSKAQPMTADWLTKSFEAMLEREAEHERWQMETAAEYRKAMEDPAFAARRNALVQACIDIGCPYPDPLNPPIISKKLYDAVQARADEILAG